MTKFLKRSFQFIGFVILAFFLYIAGQLILGTINDYQPEQIIKLDHTQTSDKQIIADSTLRFVIWNIGYGGLGKESDFFLDTENMYWSQIKKVTTDQTYVEKNTRGIADFFKTTTADFFLFQEVDVYSKRSHYVNQFEKIAQEKPDFSAVFSPNYDIPRNPIPLLQPWNTYGKVLSGLATYSAYQPTQSTRYQLPGNYSWPDRIFHLDRCAAVHRFDTNLGKELIVVNIHNSAFDKGGVLKQQQMNFLKDMVLTEYEKGNYVVMGGDWNMCPPDFAFDKFRPGKNGKYEQFNIAADFMPQGWQWVFDPSVATNRKCAHPYDQDDTFITLIDFFMVSPNIHINKVSGTDMAFNYSDHQPVTLELTLNH